MEPIHSSVISSDSLVQGGRVRSKRTSSQEATGAGHDPEILGAKQRYDVGVLAPYLDHAGGVWSILWRPFLDCYSSYID